MGSSGCSCCLPVLLLVLHLAPVPALSGSSRVQSAVKVHVLAVQQPAEASDGVVSRWLQALPASAIKLIQSSKRGTKNGSSSPSSAGQTGSGQTGGGGGGGSGGSSPELLFDAGGDGAGGVWASADAKGPRGFADPRLGQLDPLLTDGSTALRAAVDANAAGASNASMNSNATVLLGHTEVQTESNSACGRVTSEAAGSGGGGPYAANTSISAIPLQSPPRFDGAMGGLGTSSTQCGPFNTTGSGRGSGRGPNGAGGGGGGGGTSINIVSDRTNAGGGGGADGESDRTLATFGYGFGGAYGWLGTGSKYTSGAAASAGTAQAASRVAASSMTAQLGVQTASSSADEAAAGTGRSSAMVQQQAGVSSAAAASSATASASSKGGRRAEAAFAAAVNGTGASTVLGIACNLTAASDMLQGQHACSLQVSSNKAGVAVQGAATLSFTLQVINGSSSLEAQVMLLSKVSSAGGQTTRVDTTIVSNVTLTLPVGGADAARLPDVQLLPGVSAVRQVDDAGSGGALVSLRLVGGLGGSGEALGANRGSSHDAATKQVKGDDGKTVSTVTTRSWHAVSSDSGKRQLVVIRLDQAIAISSSVAA